MSAWLESFVAHDWTGVFTSVPQEGDHIVVTACHHTDNAFYQLGLVEHEVTPEQLFAAIPNEPPHACSDASICWMLDRYTDGDLVDDREVSEEQAAALLGQDIQALLEVGRRNHEAWVESA